MSSEVSRWLVAVVALALALPLLTGCAVNQGTALASDFEEHWGGTPDVAEVVVHGYNTLPFSGTATGTLVLREGTPPERVGERAEALREYVAREGSVTGRITADDITFTVAADEGRTREVLALWASLRSDARVVDGDVGAATLRGEHRWQARVTVVDADGALAVFDDLLGGGGRHRPPSDPMAVEVVTASGARPGLSIRSELDGRLPTEALAAYEAVVAELPVAGATLRDTGLSITVADPADLDAALALAREAAPGMDPAALHVGAARVG
ncbi:hypothetical protein FH609_001950 [Streptomyces sp. 3MP-14]|uniref:Uncharacterized protein n=1 Tax=Streptomyces mimosae TaxID=2586635 RepID=A0A5N6ARY3_9ACTN|nr:MULTISPECIES: hypothetical protein [Streptomyces]KAB8170872.1 hypothetical protein FH607_000520 [Streptomyces mimosae]KAB8179777.1 hypothetical protein FH609_001950 [Streptomyces sp. 3MP-14]